MGLDPSHFQFFSHVNVFLLSNFKIGKLRPEIALFQLYLVEPGVPEAHHVSLPSTNLGQLLTQKWSGSPTHMNGSAFILHVFLRGQK